MLTRIEKSYTKPDLFSYNAAAFENLGVSSIFPHHCSISDIPFQLSILLSVAMDRVSSFFFWSKKVLNYVKLFMETILRIFPARAKLRFPSSNVGVCKSGLREDEFN